MTAAGEIENNVRPAGGAKCHLSGKGETFCIFLLLKMSHFSQLFNAV